jgi:chromate reductase, NAD(P)H dehydrogenase (quinone)
MPTTRRIAALTGSLRKDSINRRLALALARLVPDGVTMQHVAIDDLPLYNQDHEADMPEPVRRLKRDIEGADAVIFVTPEYNRSIPGVLKNAIDWASRPYGSNAFAGKPGAVIGTSPGAIGTAVAQQHLRTVLAYLDVPTLGQPEAFVQFKEDLIDASGRLSDASTEAFLKKWLEAALRWFDHAGSEQQRVR